MEKIIYPELPPGYVYRKPEKSYVDKYGNRNGADDADIDVLTDDGEGYVACLRGYISVDEESRVTCAQRRSKFSEWNHLVLDDYNVSRQEALNLLVLRITLGVWE